MDLLHIANPIVVALLVLYVIDAVRRAQGSGTGRYDAEHPHPLARARLKCRRSQ